MLCSYDDGLEAVVLGWFSTTMGGQESEPRALCRGCLRQLLSPDYDAAGHIRHLTLEPVDKVNPWLPPGVSYGRLYGDSFGHGPYNGVGGNLELLGSHDLNSGAARQHAADKAAELAAAHREMAKALLAMARCTRLTPAALSCLVELGTAGDDLNLKQVLADRKDVSLEDVQRLVGKVAASDDSSQDEAQVSALETTLDRRANEHADYPAVLGPWVDYALDDPYHRVGRFLAWPHLLSDDLVITWVRTSRHPRPMVVAARQRGEDVALAVVARLLELAGEPSESRPDVLPAVEFLVDNPGTLQPLTPDERRTLLAELGIGPDDLGGSPQYARNAVERYVNPPMFDLGGSARRGWGWQRLRDSAVEDTSVAAQLADLLTRELGPDPNAWAELARAGAQHKGSVTELIAHVKRSLAAGQTP